MRIKNINRLFYCVGILFVFCVSALAQNERKAQETVLKQYFEGKQVRLKMDMPAAKSGVDVHPENPMPVNYKEHSNDVRKFGVGVRNGATGTITEVEVGDKKIEFHLDGGGYGSFSDFGSEPAKRNPPQRLAKSQREVDLENQLRTEQDRSRADYARRELDRERRRREDQDRRNYAEYERYTRERDNIIWQRRQQKGSRFVIKFKTAIPTEKITPESVMQWLAEYVEFSGNTQAEFSANNTVESVSQTSSSSNGENSSYLGEWRNGRGEVLRISGETVQFGSGASMSFREVFRVPAARAFGLEITSDSGDMQRFISVVIGENGQLKLSYYDTLADLQNGTNSKSEETWNRGF